MLSGGCHCGAVRYEMPEDVAHHALCHCTDCRKASGAPAVSGPLADRPDRHHRQSAGLRLVRARPAVFLRRVRDQPVLHQ